MTWYALEIDGLFPAPNQPPSTIDVIAMGTITASVPEVAYVFPPYNYTDIIGGQASVGY